MTLAFDRVWYKGLLYKLSSVGISWPLLQWFTDYLNNRKQRVVLPGTASSWASIKAGVPQGSILGPLLFFNLHQWYCWKYPLIYKALCRRHNINIMRKLKYKLDRRSLQTIYFSFIRPVIEYSNVVWDNYTLYEANESEKIQIEAARIVTQATKLVSIDFLYTETGWETLASRRKKNINCNFSIKCKMVFLLTISLPWCLKT